MWFCVGGLTDCDVEPERPRNVRSEVEDVSTRPPLRPSLCDLSILTRRTPRMTVAKLPTARGRRLEPHPLSAPLLPVPFPAPPRPSSLVHLAAAVARIHRRPGRARRARPRAPREAGLVTTLAFVRPSRGAHSGDSRKEIREETLDDDFRGGLWTAPDPTPGTPPQGTLTSPVVLSNPHQLRMLHRPRHDGRSVRDCKRSRYYRNSLRLSPRQTNRQPHRVLIVHYPGPKPGAEVRLNTQSLFRCGAPEGPPKSLVLRKVVPQDVRNRTLRSSRRSSFLLTPLPKDLLC